MGKLDLAKDLRELYAPPRDHPVIVEVPELAFLMIDGGGEPGGEAYQEALQAMYGTAYTLKFAVKKAEPDRDFKVMPLEGLWWVEGEPPRLDQLQADRGAWQWTMLLAVPDHITADEVRDAAAEAGRRKPLPAVERVRLETFAEGRAAQIMHVGPYAAEQPTIARLHAFVAEQGYELRGRHHEIYLGDPRRSAPERLKTVIRHPVKRREEEA